MCQELSQSKEICTQLQDLEKELGSRLNSLEKDNMELKEQNTEAQAKMNTLTEVGVCLCVSFSSPVR